MSSRNGKPPKRGITYPNGKPPHLREVPPAAPPIAEQLPLPPRQGGTGWERWHRDRDSELPPDWAARRKRVLERDGYTCTWQHKGVQCVSPATEVDHINGAHNHDESNLRSLCTPCHRIRTAAQGAEASAAARRRPPEVHPFAERARKAREQGSDGPQRS
jgi:5-methylcytosine-specific restriction protein A